MVKISKPINSIERIMIDTTKISMERNVTNKMHMDIKSTEVHADTNRHRYKREYLEAAVEQTNKLLLGRDDRFEFKVHERTGRIMVKLIDKETDEVIKEIPPEKILDLVASIWDLVGILVDERG